MKTYIKTPQKECYACEMLFDHLYRTSFGSLVVKITLKQGILRFAEQTDCVYVLFVEENEIGLLNLDEHVSLVSVIVLSTEQKPEII